MEKRGEKNRKEQKEHITTDFEILYWINTEKEEKKIQWRIAVVCTIIGAIALSYPPPYCYWWLSWKNAAESFTVALTLTLGGYESAIAIAPNKDPCLEIPHNLFLINPWIFHLPFLQYPWKFHILKPSICFFFWNNSVIFFHLSHWCKNEIATCLVSYPFSSAIFIHFHESEAGYQRADSLTKLLRNEKLHHWSHPKHYLPPAIAHGWSKLRKWHWHRTN